MSRIVAGGCGYAVHIGGSGHPLLLIHGFTGSSRTWQPHVRSFRRWARTIAIDLLGHGASDRPVEPSRHRLECQAADIASILETVVAHRGRSRTPADVFGYSFGARVGLQLALDFPEAVDRLILESPSAGVDDPAERAIRRDTDAALADELERDGIERFVERWGAQPVLASQAGLEPEVRARLNRERLANDPAGLAASLRGAGQGTMTPLGGRLAEVRAATLVLCGALDSARPRAEAVAAGIPGARLAVLEGVGHAIHLEAPDRFRELVTGFLCTERATLSASETTR